MKAAEALAALARLRDAGRALRERPAAAVIEVLADVLDAWRAPDSRWQQALVAELPRASGFAPEMIREGLARGLAPYSGEALRALVRDELGGAAALDEARVGGFEVTATVLAGAIPLPAVVAIAAPLVLRSPVLVKPSAHDPLTAGLFARALAERDPGLGACVEVADLRSDDREAVAALCAADCVVASGSDAAVAALAAQVAPPRRFLGYGHRFSAAWLGPEATRGAGLAAAAEALALDVALWDQLGCLSPVSAHVIGGERRAADRVADALAEALARAEARWPRGRAAPEAALAVAHERAEAEMRGAAAPGGALRLLVPPGGGTAWSVVREADARLRPAPLHRFVRVHPAPSIDDALAALRPHALHLAAVALAGFGAAAGEVAAALAALGASRVCAPGTLQAPPLAWRRDNLPVLATLARWSDLEI